MSKPLPSRANNFVLQGTSTNYRMMDKSTIENLRYETKIPLQRLQYQELETALLNLGIRPRRTYPDRQIHSIYLDTPEFEDYHDNIAGINQRSKTRLRWYNDDAKKLALELKAKRNKVSEKQIFWLDNPCGDAPRTRSALLDLLAMQQTNSETIILSYARNPTLEVRYHRSYFEIAENIRMTVDRKMVFRKLYPIVSNHWTRSQVDTVLEFKYPVGLEWQFNHLLRDLPFRIFRHSKYVIGTDSICVG